MKIVSCGSRPTFLESSFLADHGGMLAFAPFHTCEEHGPVAAGTRKDAMDGDLGPIFPNCRSVAPAFFMPLALGVLEAGVLGVMLRGGGQGGGEAISGYNPHDE